MCIIEFGFQLVSVKVSAKGFTMEIVIGLFFAAITAVSTVVSVLMLLNDGFFDSELQVTETESIENPETETTSETNPETVAETPEVSAVSDENEFQWLLKPEERKSIRIKEMDENGFTIYTSLDNLKIN